MKKIIMISGKAHSGKDTLANFLKIKFENEGKKVAIIHFADYLKFLCEKYFDYNPVKDIKNRNILKSIGEEARKNNSEFWCEICGQVIDGILLPHFDVIIIADLRRLNEYYYISSYFEDEIEIYTIRVNRKNNPVFSNHKDMAAHITEIELDNEIIFSYNIVVETLDELFDLGGIIYEGIH